MSKIKPVRIQRKRTKGFNLQAESLARNGLPCVYVGRPTKFGNPYRVGDVLQLVGGNQILDLEWIIWHYRQHALNTIGIQTIVSTLRGKNLVCWCKEGEPCHADVLLELANEENNENSDWKAN